MLCYLIFILGLKNEKYKQKLRNLSGFPFFIWRLFGCLVIFFLNLILFSFTISLIQFMALEIERKFLLKNQAWKSLASGTYYKQGYIATSSSQTVRVRIAGEKAFLTIKGEAVDNVRKEFEYNIPLTDAHEMLDELCQKPLIEKYRYKISFENLLWEVDEFLGENQGLIVAEVELQAADQVIIFPDWIGEEVTEDERYYNANLVKYPYSKW
jgi:adenylate cyclase